MTTPGACIFDMDELLLASVPQWRAAIDHLLAAMGSEWTPELAALYTGMNARDVTRTLHYELRPALALDDCVATLRAELLRRFEQEPLRPMPGAIDCVKSLHGRVPLAVASGSPLPCIQAAMRALGLADCFDTILSSESVPRGKPHPDVFLAAAAALGIEPHRCVVFEDSLAGVQAAAAAGMKIIAIPSGHNRIEIAQLAHAVFNTLGEVGWNEVRKIFTTEPPPPSSS